MDFLVISDHNNVRSHTDPGFGTQGVTGIQAYEASLSKGHAQMIGASKVYERGTGDSAATNALAQALRLDGGFFQANHPSGDFTGQPISSCAEASGERMDWGYGFTVLPDTVEVWNATALLQPAELFWECWLQRGARLGALAGSDSHGANHVNIGLPMVWAFAASNKEKDIIAALRGGRTTLSRIAPNQGATRLLLEGDRDRDGKFESMVGDQVPPKTPLRIRTEGGSGTGLLSVRANGKTAVDREPLKSGDVATLEAPSEPGWVRATLSLRNGVTSVDPACSPPYASPVTPCTEDLGVAAMTSPIYVAEPAPEPKIDPPAPAPKGSDAEDRTPPLPAAEQSGSQPMPDVPPQRDRPPPVSKLRATWFHAAAARHPSLRVRLRWKASEGPFDVQVRLAGVQGVDVDRLTHAGPSADRSARARQVGPARARRPAIRPRGAVAVAYDPSVTTPRWQRPLVKVLSSRGGSWYFLNVANPIDRRLIPATNGRLSTAPGFPVCVIETVGARSGVRRRIPLVFASSGEEIVLIASSGGAKKHPGWFYNLRKSPDVKVWANKGRSGDYVARVAEGEERERLWRVATELYPGYDTYSVRAGAREIPVIALSPKR